MLERIVERMRAGRYERWIDKESATVGLSDVIAGAKRVVANSDRSPSNKIIV